MNIGSYQIRVQASPVEITQELNLGDTVSAIINGDIVKVEDKDDYDGSITRTYHIKGQFAECITKNKSRITANGEGSTDKIYR